MKNNKGIQWKNIYYMLCYCVDELQYFKENLIKQEDVTGTHDLLAQLLVNSFELLYKNGYIKKYRSETITTSRPHGRLDVAESICTGDYAKGNLVCHIDTLDSNNKINQIIKAAFNVLILSNSKIDEKISENIMTYMYKYRDMLKHVDNIEVSHQLLNQKIDIPEWYKPIFAVCKMILNDWLALDESGNIRLLDLNDDKRLGYIWQKYLIAIIRKEMQGYNVKSTSWVPAGSEGVGDSRIDILIEKLDLTDVLIVDAKFYNKSKASKSNIAQVNLYCTEYNELFFRKANGMLLYAAVVDAETQIQHFYRDNRVIKSYSININTEKELMEASIVKIIKENLS